MTIKVFSFFQLIAFKSLMEAFKTKYGGFQEDHSLSFDQRTVPYSVRGFSGVDFGAFRFLIRGWNSSSEDFHTGPDACGMFGLAKW